MGEGKLKSVLFLEELEKCERRRWENLKIWTEFQKQCKVLICKFKQICVYLFLNFFLVLKWVCSVYIFFVNICEKREIPNSKKKKRKKEKQNKEEEKKFRLLIPVFKLNYKS